jgi:hypothetical protein
VRQLAREILKDQDVLTGNATIEWEEKEHRQRRRKTAAEALDDEERHLEGSPLP